MALGVLTAAAVGLAGLSAAAYGSSSARSGRSAGATSGKALTKLTFGTPGSRPGIKPQLTGPAGWALAQGKGQAILAKYGYTYGGDVAFDNGPPAAQALVAGSIQAAAIGGTPAVQGAAEGQPTRAIFAAASYGGVAIAVPTGGVTSFTQLVGKKIGVQLGSNFDQYLRYALAKNHMTGKVTLINIYTPDAYAALISHSIDAYAAPLSSDLQFAAKGGVKVIESAAKVYPTYAESNTVLVTKSFLAAHPNIQAAYWAVYKEGLALVRKNPKAYLSWSAKGAGLTLPIEKASTNVSQLYEQTAPVTKAGVAAAKLTEQFLLSQKLIKKPIALNSWLVGPPGSSK